MESLAGFAALAYTLFVGSLYAFQRRVMYSPSRHRPEPEAYGVPDMEPVRLSTKDGLELTAWYQPARDPSALTVLYFHGNNEHLGTRAYKVRHYLDAGHGVLLVSWRGFAGNPGRPTERGLYADGRAALCFLGDQGIDASRIVYYGESLGSGVAVHLAVERPPAALVLEAPYSSTVDVAGGRYPFVPVRVLMKDRFDSHSKIGGVTAPVLILHGERDRTIPVRFGRKLLDAAIEPKIGHFFPDAEHGDLYDHGAAEAVLAYLREIAPEAKSERVPA